MFKLPSRLADRTSNVPATNEEIQFTEKMIGAAFPQDLRSFYLLHNGSLEGKTDIFENRKSKRLGEVAGNKLLLDILRCVTEDPRYPGQFPYDTVPEFYSSSFPWPRTRLG